MVGVIDPDAPAVLRRNESPARPVRASKKVGDQRWAYEPNKTVRVEWYSRQVKQLLVDAHRLANTTGCVVIQYIIPPSGHPTKATTADCSCDEALEKYYDCVLHAKYLHSVNLDVQAEKLYEFVFGEDSPQTTWKPFADAFAMLKATSTDIQEARDNFVALSIALNDSACVSQKLTGHVVRALGDFDTDVKMTMGLGEVSAQTAWRVHIDVLHKLGVDSDTVQNLGEQYASLALKVGTKEASSIFNASMRPGITKFAFNCINTPTPTYDTL